MNKKLLEVWQSYRAIVFPVSAIVAFFPMVSLSFSWLLPGEARIFISSDTMSQISFNSIAFVSVESAVLIYIYKLNDSLDFFFNRLTKEFYEGKQQQSLLKTSRVMKYVTFILPIFISLLFLGLAATILFVLSLATYIYTIATILRRYDLKEDIASKDAVFVADFIYLLKILKNPMNYLSNKHGFFVFGFFVFGTAISLSAAHLISAINNDPVSLSKINNSYQFLPVSHSASGTLYLVAGDASYFKVLLTQQEKFIYIAGDGAIVCSNTAKDICE